MADLEAVLADVSYLMAMEKSKENLLFHSFLLKVRTFTKQIIKADKREQRQKRASINTARS